MGVRRGDVCEVLLLQTEDSLKPVRKAFLKGLSYAELSRATNVTERQVCFELDGDAVEVLQTLPGTKASIRTEKCWRC